MATTTTTTASRGVLQPNSSLPAKVQPIPPNQTLYLTNLPSAKIRKSDLRTALYMLFSAFGPVLDVVALKTMHMRGQAHIVFRDLQAATQAMRVLDGHEFLGRPMKIQYAKSKSHFVAKLDGSFKMPGSGAAAAEQTELQQSIFNAPLPGAATTTTTTTTAANNNNNNNSSSSSSSNNNNNTAQDKKTAAAVDHVMKDASSPPAGRGQKRNRGDESESDDSGEDVAMEEDSDDDE